MRFINNNDTGKRFIDRYGIKTAKMAAILTFALPGNPLVYIGDMIGAKFCPYQDPAPFVFNDEYGLFSFYQNLIMAKKERRSMQGRYYSESGFECPDDVYCFSRGKNQNLIVLLNFANKKREAA